MKARIWLAVLLAGMFSGPAQAIEWGDGPFTDLVDRVQEIIAQMNSGRSNVAASNIRNTIDGVGAFMASNIPNAAEMSDFTNNQCADFRNEIQLTFGSLMDLSNAFLELGSHDLGAALQDPGFVGFVDFAPCQVLFPLYRLNQRIPVFNSEFTMQAANAVNEMNMLLMLDGGIQTAMPLQLADIPAIGNNAGFELTPLCTYIQEHARFVDIARHTTLTVGIVAAAIGGILKVVGHTALNGPDEFEAGAWGFAQVAIENDPLKATGIFFNEAGKILIQMASAASSSVMHCRVTERLRLLHTEHAELQQAHTELQDGQKEIVRLLLTPQGRRQSDFCLEENCDFPAN